MMRRLAPAARRDSVRPIILRAAEREPHASSNFSIRTGSACPSRGRRRGHGGVEADSAELFETLMPSSFTCCPVQAGDGIDINNIGVCREEVFGEVVFIAARRTAADLGGLVKGGAGAPDLATISWLFAVLGLMIWPVA